MAAWFSRFREAREANGYTQQQAADLIGVSRSAIGMYEQGNREPDLATLVHIAMLYNVSIDYLLTRDVTATVTSENRRRTREMTDREMERILLEEQDEEKVMEAIRQYSKERAGREDKQAICDALCRTLRLTRQHSDLVSLTYNYRDQDHQQVTVAWENGGTSVNVSMDSGIAMIRDILKAIQ